MRQVRDCTVPNGDCQKYVVEIDGDLTVQNRMFTRSDMAFWGFGVDNVVPPKDHRLTFFCGEPVFVHINDDSSEEAA